MELGGVQERGAGGEVKGGGGGVQESWKLRGG